MKLPEHISYIYHPIRDIPLHQAPDTLSDKEKKYLETITHEKRRREFTAGRILARQKAASLLDIPPNEVRLDICEDGSLDLTDTPYSISLAHTKHGACAVIGFNTRVGIDLETIQERHENLHQFILSKEEYPLLETLPMDRDRILILCWTLKEATLKGMRTGFRNSPKKLRLHIDHTLNQAEIVGPDNEVWRAHYTEHDNSYLSIAYQKPETRHADGYVHLTDNEVLNPAQPHQVATDEINPTKNL